MSIITSITKEEVMTMLMKLISVVILIFSLYVRYNADTVDAIYYLLLAAFIYFADYVYNRNKK